MGICAAKPQDIVPTTKQKEPATTQSTNAAGDNVATPIQINKPVIKDLKQSVKLKEESEQYEEEDEGEQNDDEKTVGKRPATSRTCNEEHYENKQNNCAKKELPPLKQEIILQPQPMHEAIVKQDITETEHPDQSKFQQTVFSKDDMIKQDNIQNDIKQETQDYADFGGINSPEVVESKVEEYDQLKGIQHKEEPQASQKQQEKEQEVSSSDKQQNQVNLENEMQQKLNDVLQDVQSTKQENIHQQQNETDKVEQDKIANQQQNNEDPVSDHQDEDVTQVTQIHINLNLSLQKQNSQRNQQDELDLDMDDTQDAVAHDVAKPNDDENYDETAKQPDLLKRKKRKAKQFQGEQKQKAIPQKSEDNKSYEIEINEQLLQNIKQQRKEEKILQKEEKQNEKENLLNDIMNEDFKHKQDDNQNINKIDLLKDLLAEDNFDL